MVQDFFHQQYDSVKFNSFRLFFFSAQKISGVFLRRFRFGFLSLSSHGTAREGLPWKDESPVILKWVCHTKVTPQKIGSPIFEAGKEQKFVKKVCDMCLQKLHHPQQKVDKLVSLSRCLESLVYHSF